MSFSAGTRVLLAAGTADAISQLKPSDKVLATNVKTGKTQPEPVTAVLVHHEKTLDHYDLRVRTAHGTAVVTLATHLFWDADIHRSVKAAALKYGADLRAPGGHGSITVLNGSIPVNRAGWMVDLAVTGTTTSTSRRPRPPCWSTTTPVPLGTKTDIETYMAGKPTGSFDADFP